MNRQTDNFLEKITRDGIPVTIVSNGKYKRKTIKISVDGNLELSGTRLFSNLRGTKKMHHYKTPLGITKNNGFTTVNVIGKNANIQDIIIVDSPNTDVVVQELSRLKDLRVIDAMRFGLAEELDVPSRKLIATTNAATTNAATTHTTTPNAADSWYNIDKSEARTYRKLNLPLSSSAFIPPPPPLSSSAFIPPPPPLSSSAFTGLNAPNSILLIDPNELPELPVITENPSRIKFNIGYFKQVYTGDHRIQDKGSGIGLQKRHMGNIHTNTTPRNIVYFNKNDYEKFKPTNLLHPDKQQKSILKKGKRRKYKSPKINSLSLGRKKNVSNKRRTTLGGK